LGAVFQVGTVVSSTIKTLVAIFVIDPFDISNVSKYSSIDGGKNEPEVVTVSSVKGPVDKPEDCVIVLLLESVIVHV